MKKSTLAVFLVVSASSLSLRAQTVITFTDTAMVSRMEAPMDAPPIMSEKWNQIHTRYFNLNIGAALLFDYNIVGQDDNSLEQVGNVEPASEFRGERLVLSGNLLFFKRPWRYMFSANYNGLDAPQGTKRISYIDWNLEIPFGKKGGWLTMGKQKEGVAHEYVAPGTQLIFMERGSGVPMFVRQRNIGIRYSNSILNQMATYTLGLFNNYWETGQSFSDNGSQVTARITGLPLYTSDRDLLHLGIGYRFTEASNGKLSYKAKPEANTAPFYLNTGSFDAKNANTFMLEAIKVQGPLSFIAEYMHNVVNSSGNGDPAFNYWTLGGSWFITGDNRKYNKNTGNLGKLLPKKAFTFKKGGGMGAFEVGARYTRSNLSDETIHGGTFRRFTGAFSWYPNAHFRFSVNYGKGNLDKDGLSGKSDFWQLRAQFEL